MALPFTAGIPGVGEAVAGVAAGGKFIEHAAKGVSRYAGAVDSGYKAGRAGGRALKAGRHAVQDLRGGHPMDAIRDAEKAYKEGRSAYDLASKARRGLERRTK
jgi:hypothetical protein